MRVEVVSGELGGLEAGLVVLGLAEGEPLPDELREVAGAGDVKTAFRKLTVLRPAAPARLLIVGLGQRDELDAERLRVVAALAVRQARAYEATSIAWLVPDPPSGLTRAEVAAAVVEGTILAAYRFDRYRSGDPDEPEPPAIDRLALAVPADELDAVAAEAEIARVVSEATNRARELQHLPPNVLTPAQLAARAEELAGASDAVDVEVLGPDAIKARRMGGIVAVSAGSETEPRLIALRYHGCGSEAAAGPRDRASGSGAGRTKTRPRERETIGLVGKAVTFDSGGISIKPSSGMHEMKMDMSGGAAVIEAFAAIVELGLPLDLVAVVPAVENMPSGSATRPGDIITQLNGKTVEVTNTDAEGRLILADALTYCVRELGADRVVDLATLTGAVVVALGSTYAALISNDDEWAAAVTAAADGTGELAWRLPLHREYKQLTKGTVTDLVNSAAKRKAGPIYAGSFLEEFVDDVPWAHLDIAGTAWDVGREYVGKGPTGFGVRLLVRLARDLALD